MLTTPGTPYYIFVDAAVEVNDAAAPPRIDITAIYNPACEYWQFCNESGACEDYPPGKHCQSASALPVAMPVSGNTAIPRFEGNFTWIACGGSHTVSDNLGGASPENIYLFVPKETGIYTFRLSEVSWHAVRHVSEEDGSTMPCSDTIGASTCRDFMVLYPDGDGGPDENPTLFPPRMLFGLYSYKVRQM